MYYHFLNTLPPKTNKGSFVSDNPLKSWEEPGRLLQMAALKQWARQYYSNQAQYQPYKPFLKCYFLVLNTILAQWQNLNQVSSTTQSFKSSSIHKSVLHDEDVSVVPPEAEKSLE